MKTVVEESTFHLAVVRTEIANATTMLSHVQGSVALLISAIGVAKFLDSFWLSDLCGIGLVVASVTVLIRGIRLYHRTKNKIENEKKQVMRALAPVINAPGF
jgi:uncharacterized membrane protein YidH (DUF202 family)